MSTIRKDEHGVYIIQNGGVVRPFTDMPTKYGVGDKIKAHHRSQSQIHIVGDEKWVWVGLSKEFCTVMGKEFVSPEPISTRDPYHP